ncbi:MAG: AMP-binding protein, partial [Betaproteobacteria bacterium]
MIGYQLSILAARRPEAAALVFGARRFDYATLNERACRLANGLKALRVGRGDRVAALLHNCNHFVEALFATAKIGAVFVPINFRLVAREVGELLDACGPKVLLAGNGFADMLGGLSARPAFPQHRMWIDDQIPAGSGINTADKFEAWLATQAVDEPDDVVLPGNVQMLLHSSGTTGLPKGIIYTHISTLASSTAKIIDFGLTLDDVTVVFGPLFHAGPLMDLTMPLLLRGGRVVLGASRQFNPAQLLAAVAAERGTVVPIYPTMLRRLLNDVKDLSSFDLASLRMIITGGEPVPIPVIRGVLEKFPRTEFIVNYGSTEGGPITTYLAPEENLRKIGSVGKECFSVEVRIADDHDEPAAPGQVGELLVRSPFVCRGYWNRPELTEAVSRNGWWHTGDLAYRDDEGFIYIAGRRKDMIKSGTENIYPTEVEQAIATLTGVVEVGVIGVPDETWGETVAAFVVQAPAASLDAARVIAHCKEQIASYKKPHYVIFVEGLPRNTTNKVDKNVLRAQFAARGTA